MNERNNTKQTRGSAKIIIPLLVIGIVALGIGYFLLQGYLRDQIIEQFNTAYAAADCVTVIEQASEIIDSNQYKFEIEENARNKSRYCERFIQAQDAIESGTPGVALNIYASIYYQEETDAIGMAERIPALFDAYTIEELQDSQACLPSTLPYYRQLISEDTRAEFELLCGRTLVNAGFGRAAVTLYENMVDLYEGTPQGNNAATAIADIVFEMVATVLTSDEVEDYDINQAVLAVTEFTETYPDHPQAEDVDNMLPDLLLRQVDIYLANEPSIFDYDNALETLTRIIESYPNTPQEEVAASSYPNTLLAAGLAVSEPDTSYSFTLTPALLNEQTDPMALFGRSERLLTEFVENYTDHPEIETAHIVLADVLYNGAIHAQIVTAGGDDIDLSASLFGTTNPAPIEDFSRAIIMFSRFLERYPNDQRAPDVQELLNHLIEIQTEIGGEIPQPDAVPIDGEETILIIQNASPYPMRVSLFGSEVRQVDMAACDSCDIYTEAPPTCPIDGPVVTLRLRPGPYRISVFSGDGGVTAFTGNWNLSGGFEYPNCFFIIQNPG